MIKLTTQHKGSWLTDLPAPTLITACGREHEGVEGDPVRDIGITGPDLDVPVQLVGP